MEYTLGSAKDGCSPVAHIYHLFTLIRILSSNTGSDDSGYGRQLGTSSQYLDLVTLDSVISSGDRETGDEVLDCEEIDNR